jgi:hypothetical protein
MWMKNGTKYKRSFCLILYGTCTRAGGHKKHKLLSPNFGCSHAISTLSQRTPNIQVHIDVICSTITYSKDSSKILIAHMFHWQYKYVCSVLPYKSSSVRPFIKILTCTCYACFNNTCDG